MSENIRKGGISVETQNIFPVIKKWLYSDKDIFLRELVSNGCDAVTKHKRLVSLGEAPSREENYRVDVVLDTELGTLTVKDNGIGMDEEEIEEEYGDEIAEYREFANCEDHDESMIRSFQFCLGDCTVDVGCLVHGYSELVAAYAEYAEDKWTLDEWRLIPEIEETDENLHDLDDELRSLNDDCGSNITLKYFIPNEFED